MLAKDALEKTGGTVIAMAKVGEKLTVHGNGVNQSTILIEVNTYEKLFTLLAIKKHYQLWTMVHIEI